MGSIGCASSLSAGLPGTTLKAACAAAAVERAKMQAKRAAAILMPPGIGCDLRILSTWSGCLYGRPLKAAALVLAALVNPFAGTAGNGNPLPRPPGPVGAGRDSP